MRQMWHSAPRRGLRLIASLFSAIYPASCPCCNGPSDSVSSAPLCISCWSQIKRYTGPSCPVCATPLISEHARQCGKCLQGAPPFSRVLNFGIYSGVLSEAIHLFKFSGLKRLARPLGRLLAELPVPPADGIVSVPVTSKTLRERGFNQALLLSKSLSDQLNIPLYMDTLYKKRETLPQIRLSAKERLSNLKNAFGVRGDLSGRKLLLLDDVMTTGATVHECSRALIKAGAREVVVITLARPAPD